MKTWTRLSLRRGCSSTALTSTTVATSSRPMMLLLCKSCQQRQQRKIQQDLDRLSQEKKVDEMEKRIALANIAPQAQTSTLKSFFAFSQSRSLGKKQKSVAVAKDAQSAQEENSLRQERQGYVKTRIASLVAQQRHEMNRLIGEQQQATKALYADLIAEDAEFESVLEAFLSHPTSANPKPRQSNQAQLDTLTGSASTPASAPPTSRE